MKERLKLILVVSLVVIFLGAFIVLKFGNFNEEKEFDVDKVLIRVSMKENVSLSREILINSYSEQDFKIQNDIDFILTDDKEFKLGSGESKRVNFLFNIKGKAPGVYLNEINILGGKSEIAIPVIIEIETKEVLFDSSLNIPVEYTQVYPGENVIVENRIFNLENVGSKSVQIYYFVKSLDGKTLFSENENIAVESNTLMTKSFLMPDDAKVGDYIIINLIKYKNSVGISTSLFKVEDKSFEDYLSGDNFYMWVVFILLLVVIIFILYNMKQKDQFLLELASQHKTELNKELVALEKEKEKLEKLPLEKKKIELKDLETKKKKRVGIISKIYRSRVKVVKKLKKHKKENEIKKKLSEWKKQGYNVNEFSAISGKTDGNIEDKIKKFKKEGFKY